MRKIPTRGWTSSALPLLAAGAVLWGLTGPASAEELHPILQQELKEIRDHIDTINRRATRYEPDHIRSSVTELKNRIEEFTWDADVERDDPMIVELNENVDGLLTNALKISAERAAKEMARKEAAERIMSMGRKGMGMMAGEGQYDDIPVDLNNVSFKKDVAPIVMGACGRCHNARRQSGDFDATNFASFRQYITPGKPGDSHLLDLVTGKEEPRMPRGNVDFPDRWLEIWTKWVEQGAKYDGPKGRERAEIATYMVDFDTQRKQYYAKLPQKELETLHEAESDRQVRIVFGDEDVNKYVSTNAIIQTPLSPGDAEYVGVLTDAVIEKLVQMFGMPKDKPVWKGRLGVNVLTSRAGYLSFSRQVDEFDPADNITGHARNEPKHQYVATYPAEETGVGLDGSVTEHVTSAFLRWQPTGKIDDWAVYGFSRYMARQFDPSSLGLRDEMRKANELAWQQRSLLDVFGKKLPWVEAAPMATSFIQYAMDNEPKKTVAFLKDFCRSGDCGGAMERNLGNPQQLARGWVQWAAGQHKK
ncbi:hypothetical protein Pan216_24230 [Planctomycetes bacterium Pan216]|uniref:Cytochrome C Planctomycete-type domain-containing protein n=1 Tax=Kolteria novifilia TaxID=2527975 RepID=A0A518B3Q0_9BACT|nr:hypothetical protein Pan216_24230 [Planctomycetes bacterium Pan216]